MRTRIPSLVVAAALIALPACSSLPTQEGTAKPAKSSYRQKFDSQMMAAVESAATRSGTEVYWINPPRKSKKD